MKTVLIVGFDIFMKKQRIDTFIRSPREDFNQSPGSWWHVGKLTFRNRLENYNGPSNEANYIKNQGCVYDGQTFFFN
jgi:hypothetical protein